MEQLRYSMQRMGFSAEDVVDWYRCYFSTATLSPVQRALTVLIRLRGGRRALRKALKQTTKEALAPAAVTAAVPQVETEFQQRRAA